MGTETVGKVIVTAKIENEYDAMQVDSGHLAAAGVRAVEVDDALVDTGATTLSMPARMIRQLGLRRTRTRRAKTPVGIKEFNVYAAARLTVQGRDCVVEVTELSDDCPVLIGQVPLELLDFVVDPIGQRLIGNPDHGGEQMMEMY